LHIYKDTGKLVLRKPDDRAPAYTSAMILENWYSKHCTPVRVSRAKNARTRACMV